MIWEAPALLWGGRALYSCLRSAVLVVGPPEGQHIGSDLVQALTPGDPGQLGEYRLTGVLGRGGQGTVYLGQGPTGQQVAVKALHIEALADDNARQRFLQEAESARRVAPFCTARVLDVGIADERPYIVSEHIPGPSLDELVRKEGPRSGSGLERLAVTTLTALAAIHRAGIVHRDFKPSNVILGPEGPVVIDFGIARALDRSATHSVMGTPAFMAPEQFEGSSPASAMDMFSWATTMIYAASGQQAFRGDTFPAVMHAIMTREPDLSAVPDELRPMLTACLAKNPASRPSAANLLRRITGEELPAALAEQPTLLSGPPPATLLLPDSDQHTVRPAVAVHGVGAHWGPPGHSGGQQPGWGSGGQQAGWGRPLPGAQQPGWGAPPMHPHARPAKPKTGVPQATTALVLTILSGFFILILTIIILIWGRKDLREIMQAVWVVSDVTLVAALVTLAVALRRTSLAATITILLTALVSVTVSITMVAGFNQQAVIAVSAVQGLLVVLTALLAWRAGWVPAVLGTLTGLVSTATYVLWFAIENRGVSWTDITHWDAISALGYALWHVALAVSLLVRAVRAGKGPSPAGGAG
ncbi:protein kinase domain-containing protein [Nonomuraea dietziae]|uniref:protein kinase domain-containing protein n=1 Tax=Nonomuraea dietziae TaxID=65515 RepID=UPI0028A61C20|nr:protein kinase [Nonomuraea dietziae]